MRLLTRAAATAQALRRHPLSTALRSLAPRCSCARRSFAIGRLRAFVAAPAALRGIALYPT